MSGTITEYGLPSGSEPDGITAGSDDNLWFTEYGTGKIGKITTSGTVSEYSLPSGSAPMGIATGTDKNLWFTDYGTNKVGKITTSGTVTEYSLPSGSEPYDVTAGPDGNLWFTEYESGKIGKITTSGTVSEYSLPSGSKPVGVTAGPDGNLWITVPEYNDGVIGKITTSGVATYYFTPFGSYPTGITAGSDGNMWFTDRITSKIGKITAGGTINEYSVPSESEPDGIAAGPDGNVWFAAQRSGKVGKVVIDQGESYAPQPGATVEYGVPLEGAGAPQQMGVNSETGKPEPEKWGQTDDPTYATAIFPPDESQSWPASDNRRATTYYFDEQARTVNVASPSGAVSTSEYNTTNNVVRSLSATNRETALKEGDKSAEVAKLLDTESVYRDEGTQLVETRGPQHMVKIAHGNEKVKSGSEVLARNHVKYYYDEGAPSGETYDLLTKTTDGAETAGKEEFDVRTSTTSYSGQYDLGWKLRKPTSVMTDPSGLNLTLTTAYDPSTGNVLETRTPGSGSESEKGSLAYSSEFGSEGTGAGQFSEPSSLTTDSSGDVWVADEHNERVEEFSSEGVFVRMFGSQGPGVGQFAGPDGVAIDGKGNLWVSDQMNDRIDEFTSEGVFVKAFGWGVSNGESKLETCTSSCRAGLYGSGSGEFALPDGLAFDSKGDLFVADRGNNRVQEFSSEDAYVRSISNPERKDGGPADVAVNSSGDLWVTYWLEPEVDEFSPEGSLIRSFGSGGSEPGQVGSAQRLTVGPEGDIWLAEYQSNRVQVFSPTGEYQYGFGTYGTGEGKFWHPMGISIHGGNAYVLDNGNDRVEKWTIPVAGSEGAHDKRTIYYSAAANPTVASCGEHPEWANLPCQTGPAAQPAPALGQFAEPSSLTTDSSGDVWVADEHNDRIEEFTSEGVFVRMFGSQGPGVGQFAGPDGVAIDGKGNLWVSDQMNDRIEEFTSEGVFVKAFGWGVSNGESKLETCTSSCRAGLYGSGSGEFALPDGLAFDSKGDLFVADRGNDRVEEFNSEGAFVRSIANPERKDGGPADVAVNASGDLWVTYWLEPEVDEFSPEGSLIRSFGSGGSEPGQVGSAQRLTVGPEGDIWLAEYQSNRVQVFSSTGEYKYGFGTYGHGEGQFWHPMGISVHGGSAYVLDNGNDRVEKWTLGPPATYQSSFGSQDTPPLPVTTIAYNMWDEPETVLEAFGPTTRTKKTRFDGAGRALTSEVTSSNDTPVPAVTDHYSESSGMMIEQSETVEGKEKTISSVYNTLGELERYTDADGNTSTYSYDVDGRVIEMTDGQEKTYQKYGYDETTGFLTSLVDSAAGTFTASYGPPGRCSARTIPTR